MLLIHHLFLFLIIQTIIYPSHHYPCPSSQYYRELISISPPLAFQRPDRRLTSLLDTFHTLTVITLILY